MPTSLGATQFAILQAHADAGDRIAYYTQLQDWGYNYGGLALSVVTNDITQSLSGATANIFFLQNAGKPVSHDELATVSLNLMRFDLAARQSFAGSASGQELPVDTVQDYHATAFGLVGVSVDAWTPNFVLGELDTVAEREAYWDSLLNSSSIGAWLDTAIEALSPPSLAGAAYITELTITGGLALTAPTTDYGPFSISLGNADGGVMAGGNELDNVVTGTSGADVLIGFDGADSLYGGNGDDRLYGGTDGLIPNGDLMDGGQGLDTYYAGTFDNANDSGTDGALDVYNMNGGSFSDADGAYDGAALIQGLGLPSLPFFSLARASAMSVSAEESAPTLGDYINAGIVTYTMDENGARVLEVVSTGQQLIENNANWGDGGFDLDVGREGISARGTTEDDRMYGDRDANLMVGLDGDDRLVGRSGDDEISGGSGDDRVFGGRGDDEVYGDRGDDVVHGGHGDDNIWGNTGDDRLFGNHGDDAMSGGLGNDLLVGGSGDDVLRGNAGADRLFGGSGSDTADYAGSSAGVDVSLTGWFGWHHHQAAAGGDAEGDVLHSIENLTGSDFDDTLTGNSASNVLTGGVGSDLLSGGYGNDVFVFETGDGADTITDLQASGHGHGRGHGRHHSRGDQIKLDVDGYDDFDAIQAITTTDGDDVIINFGGGDSLTLLGISIDTLDQGDFLFA